MQPLQNIFYCRVANRIYLHIWQENMTTIMQPSHCDLYSQVPKILYLRTYKCIQSSLKSPLYCRNKLISKRTTRNRRTHELPVIAGCSYFTRKNTRCRSPISSPKQTPCNLHIAVTMRFVAPFPFVATSISPHFPQSPSFVVPFRHHPSSSLPSIITPFVITLRHHFPQSPPFIAFFYMINYYTI